MNIVASFPGSVARFMASLGERVRLRGQWMATTSSDDLHSE